MDKGASREILPCSISGCDDLGAHEIYNDCTEDYVYEDISEKLKVVIPGWARCSAPEVLFGGYDDNVSIAQCILSSVSKVSSEESSFGLIAFPQRVYLPPRDTSSNWYWVK